MQLEPASPSFITPQACSCCAEPLSGHGEFDASGLCLSCAARTSPRCARCEETIWPGSQRDKAVRIALVSGDELALVHAGCVPSHILRCAWTTWQEYGGPEEGGWYFTAGALMAAVPVALFPVLNGVATVDFSDAERTDYLLEVAVGDGARLTYELAMPAAHFPAERPHYQ